MHFYIKPLNVMYLYIGCPKKSVRFNFVINAHFSKLLIFLFKYKVHIKVKVKVKQSRYRPGVAQRVPRN